MSPFKVILVGLILNVTAVLVMERVKVLWRGAPPLFVAEAWLAYAVIAVTIVAAQFCIIKVSLADAFPMYAAISIFITFVLTFAMLNGCRTSGRWPTAAEGLALAAFLAAAFVFQYVSSSAERVHQDRQSRATADRDV